MIHNKHYNAIDLGLINSEGKKVLFADKNIGAEHLLDNGLYFQWGDTKGFKLIKNNLINGWHNYKYRNHNGKFFEKYDWKDRKFILDSEDDAATVNMGPEWRMPSYEEFHMLLDDTKIKLEFIDIYNNVVEKTKIGKLKGVKCISLINGNSIFLPCSGNHYVDSIAWVNSNGRYWTNSILEKEPFRAVGLYFCYSGYFGKGAGNRYYGRNIRGVKIVD